MPKYRHISFDISKDAFYVSCEHGNAAEVFKPSVFNSADILYKDFFIFCTYHPIIKH